MVNKHLRIQIVVVYPSTDQNAHRQSCCVPLHQSDHIVIVYLSTNEKSCTCLPFHFHVPLYELCFSFASIGDPVTHLNDTRGAGLKHGLQTVDHLGPPGFAGAAPTDVGLLHHDTPKELASPDAAVGHTLVQDKRGHLDLLSDCAEHRGAFNALSQLFVFFAFVLKRLFM